MKIDRNKKLLFFCTKTFMTCATGAKHTVTLSECGTVYVLGESTMGQLGLGNEKSVQIPTPIPNLPIITEVSCGEWFTVCVDNENFMWSFGNSNHGQLGTGNTETSYSPQKILDIPPVRTISCGESHTLILTTDANIWSCGRNNFGQLCLEHEENQLQPQQTKFSNISNISASSYHSMFRNDNGEIFGCGANRFGQLGLGHNNSPQIEVCQISYQPPNIIQFCSGKNNSLFLDADGNVFSVGYNNKGSLGIGNRTDQNVVTQISNIPPIRSISCSGHSCYLIDFHDDVWSFGENMYGQLGHGDTEDRTVPTKITSFKKIKQISCGCMGNHVLVKNSKNQIFVLGWNKQAQLTRDPKKAIPKDHISTRKGDHVYVTINPELYISIPKKLKSQYYKIWGTEQRGSNTSTAKSARK